MTTKSLNSINDQSFKNIQKILVNRGKQERDLIQLRDIGALTSDWQVINFPDFCIDNSILEAAYCIKVKSALAAANGEFFFGMNDDDFLAPDFFERMSVLFNKYPDAISGVGLMNRYFYADSKIISAPVDPDNKDDWRSRPEFEDGINVFRKVYMEHNYFYNPNPGFAYVCKTDKIREVESSYFYGAGYPDNSCVIQVVSRGKTVFDPNAHMYWGRHAYQEHINYDVRHYWECFYKPFLFTISNINTEFMRKFHPNLIYETKAIKKFFKHQLIDASMAAITIFLIKKKYIRRENLALSQLYESEQKFPLLRHTLIIFSSPFYLFRIILKKINKL
jgi:hypothetical protein